MAIQHRRLDYANDGEPRRYLELFYAIPAELDEYRVARSSAYIEDKITKARAEEDETNTFAGIALLDREIVGLHLLRRFEEGDHIGAHVAGLWVAESQRRRGVARTLKELGEEWARSIGASFLNTNVHVKNARMRELNRRIGFEPYKMNLRKRL